MKFALKITYLLIVGILVLPKEAYASYLDPGTGSMIVQATIAALASGAIMVKVYWRRIVQLFRKKP